MIRTLPIALACLLSAGLVACSSGVSPSTADEAGTSGGGPDAGGPSPLEAKPGQLALRVQRAFVAKSREGSAGAWSRSAVFLTVTLANGMGGRDVPLNVLLLAVKTDAGIGKTVTTDAPFVADGVAYDAATFLDGKPCDSAATLSAGASLTCNVAVPFEGDVSPVEIRYSTPAALAQASGVGPVAADADTRTATAAIQAPPCAPCGAVCTNLQRDHGNCGACGVGTPRTGATCSGGKPQCTTPGLTFCPTAGSAEGACVDTTTDPRNCGACGNGVVYGATCRQGTVTCDTAGATPCSTGCVDVSTSEASCGACGKACGASEFCDRTSCVGRGSLTKDGTTCTAYCQSLGKACIAGKSKAEYSPGPTPGKAPCETASWACDASTYGTAGGYDGRCGTSVFTFSTFNCACD